MMKKRIIFLHVKKSAGTTLNSVLTLQYVRKRTFWISPGNPESSFLKLSQNEKNSIDLLRGHINFGCHEWFSDDSAYITVLREPKKRVFSYLNYWTQESIAHRDKNGWWFQLIREHSPEDLLAKEMHFELENGMVRQLSGKGNSDERCNQHDLDLAMHNLEKRCIAFGLTERFNDSLALFQQALGWRMPIVFSSAKVRSQNIIQLDERLSELILERNTLDEKLYQFAKELFEERCRIFNTSKKVERIEKVNNILSPLVSSLKRMK